MNLTNNYQLPESIVKAVANDQYFKGENVDFSVTELLKPSRIWALEKQFKNQTTEDVSDRLWSLYGQIAHLILERANEKDLSEERYKAKFASFTVSGQIDNYTLKDGILSDYKFTSSWSFIQKEPKPEWIAQLNMQAEILRRNSLRVNKLQIIGLLRDWSKPESRRNESYPQKPVAIVDIPFWSDLDATAFIIKRIRSHHEALDVLPKCSKEDRWAEPDRWALKKKGNKKATKLFDDPILANEIATSTPNMEVEYRKGESKRCAMYCQVSNYCLQDQEEIKQKENKSE